MSRDGFVLWFCLLALGVAVVGVIYDGKLSQERAENRKLREAFSAVVSKMPPSCELAEGERVICALKDGAVSRLTLAADDQVVSARAVGAPLGKKKRKAAKAERQ